MKAATPAKLRNGDWGARVTGPAEAGDSIRVTTKGGKSWTCIVHKVVWSGDGATLVSTRKKPDTCYVGGRHYKREAGYCYYPCPVTKRVCSPENGLCHDCQ